MASISVDPRKLSTALGPLATGWLLTGLGGIGIVLLAGLWFGLATPLTVVVDGVEQRITTHRHDLDALLRDLNITLSDQDRVYLGDNQGGTALWRGQRIEIERAQAFRILVDGRTLTAHSWGASVGEVLQDAGLVVDAYDVLTLDGAPVAIHALLPSMERGELAGAGWPELGNGAAATRPAMHEIQVTRAIPLLVHDGGVAYPLKTTAQTVGEALRQAELTIYLGDRVDPELSTPVTPGLRVHIQRSKPVHLLVGDYEMRTRTRAETVAEALAEMRIGLSGMDWVTPALDTPIAEGIAIRITHVHEEVLIEEDIAPFDTVFVPDPNLAIDTQQVNAVGAEGITRTRYRVRYENGQEVGRVLEDTWIAQEPSNRIIAYGQRIEPRTMTANDGTQITYWRHIRMHASSYSAGTAGVSPSNPHYGRTRTGDRMRHGIVAVDPSIIPLRSHVYVPGYGRGEALDTGSAIISRRIDLGYDDSNLVLWNRWVDVYLLWPPPPAHQITWVIPNWPRPPQ